MRCDTSHLTLHWRQGRERLTVDGHPEDEERHAVELSAAADAEAEALDAALELHGEVLVRLLGQVPVDLLVLLQQTKYLILDENI